MYTHEDNPGVGWLIRTVVVYAIMATSSSVVGESAFDKCSNVRDSPLGCRTKIFSEVIRRGHFPEVSPSTPLRSPIYTFAGALSRSSFPYLAQPLVHEDTKSGGSP